MGKIINNKKSLSIEYIADNSYEFNAMIERMKNANKIINGCENNPKLSSLEETNGNRN